MPTSDGPPGPPPSSALAVFHHAASQSNQVPDFSRANSPPAVAARKQTGEGRVRPLAGGPTTSYPTCSPHRGQARTIPLFPVPPCCQVELRRFAARGMRIWIGPASWCNQGGWDKTKQPPGWPGGAVSAERRQARSAQAAADHRGGRRTRRSASASRRRRDSSTCRRSAAGKRPGPRPGPDRAANRTSVSVGPGHRHRSCSDRRHRRRCPVPSSARGKGSGRRVVGLPRKAGSPPWRAASSGSSGSP